MLEWTCRIAQRYSPVTLARVSWIGSRQWGRDSSDAHATSRNTLEKGTIGGRATPYRNRPHENERKDDPHPVSFACDPGKGVLDWCNTVGTHSREAHATSRNTQTREPSEAELLPTGIDPTSMDSAMTSTFVGYVESKVQLSSRPNRNPTGCTLDRIPARSNDTCLCRKFHRNLRPSPVTLNGSLDTTSAKRLGFPSFINP
jgi:hypothetical protein